MAARQVRPRRAPQLQESSAEPPVFIPLGTAVKTEEQPSHPQPQEAARSQRPSRKEPVVQDAQARFRNQRKEVHEGRRAFQEQREALGLSTSSSRHTDRHVQAPATEAAAKELRQSLRDVYFDLEREGAEFSSSSSDKVPKAKRQSQQALSRKSLGQDKSPREGSADRRGRSTSTSATSFRSQGLRDEEQHANSKRRVAGALEGARNARGAESSLQRGHKAAQQGGSIGMHSQLDKHSSQRERGGNQDDTLHKGSSQVADTLFSHSARSSAVHGSSCMHSQTLILIVRQPLIFPGLSEQCVKCRGAGTAWKQGQPSQRPVDKRLSGRARQRWAPLLSGEAQAAQQPSSLRSGSSPGCILQCTCCVAPTHQHAHPLTQLTEYIYSLPTCSGSVFVHHKVLLIEVVWLPAQLRVLSARSRLASRAQGLMTV